MKVIVLTGLVSVEKADLVAELAGYSASLGQSVQLIDNIARQPLSKTLANTQNIVRVQGDDLDQLVASIAQASADVVIVAVSEQAHPEKLFLALDDLRDAFDTVEMITLAMIDTRTCDCFPNVRQALELYADVSLMMPYDLEQVLDYVAIA